MVPTGHIHPQNPFFINKEVTRTAMKSVKAAGWSGSIIPVKRKNLKDISPDMGRKASTEDGLWTKGCAGSLKWSTK
jgi:hypothetical protein